MKTAIITGAAKGIGKSAAFKFAKDGYYTALIDIDEEVKNVSNNINKMDNNTTSYPFVADISQSNQVKDTIELIADKFDNRLDVLVNNAGIVPVNNNKNLLNLIDSISDSELDKIFKTNIYSMFYLSREVVPIMKKNNYGIIINIGSVATVGLPVNSHYSASKSAVDGFTRSAARELSEFNIRVFCIAPGLVDTSLIAPMTEEEKKSFVNMQLVKELIPAWEIANLIMYLANPDAKSLTGQILHVNAGTFLR